MQRDNLEIPAFLKRSSIEDLTKEQKVKVEKEREERKNVKSISNEPIVTTIVQERPPKEKVVKMLPAIFYAVLNLIICFLSYSIYL